MLSAGGRPFLDTLIDEIVRYDAFEEILLLADHQAEHVLADYAGTVRGRTRLTIAFGPSSSNGDVAYLGFGDETSISLGPADLELQTLTKPVSG